MSEMQPETKYTKVPFSLEEMKEYFLDKNKFFIINYKDSELKGNRFLSYVGNLEIPFEIDYTGVSKEEKFELIQEFLKSRNLIKLTSMALTMGEILLHYRGIHGLKLTDKSLLTLDEMDELIKLNPEMIERWNLFMQSTNLFMLTTVKAINDFYKFKDNHKEIADASFVGQNIIQLFSVPGFMECFLSKPLDRELVYFKHQFEDYIYKGNNLYFYFKSPENTPYAIFEAIAQGSMSVDQLATLKGENP